MSPKTKRKKQVDKLSRKKGRYISQELTIETLTDFNFEEGIVTESETDNYWTEKNLQEFEETGNRLINEVLHWHKDAANSIRAVYTGTSRTTTWRHKNKKKELENDAKGMKTLNTFFENTETLSSPQLPRPFLESLSSSLSFEDSLISVEITKNLQIRLEEINQQCSISKSIKSNHNIFTYDYLRCLSIRKYIELLLDGQGKMDASNQIAHAMWNKGNYMSRCI